MKRLLIKGTDGIMLVDQLVNLEGYDFSQTYTLPIFMPLLSIELTEIDDKDKKKLEKAISWMEL